MTDDGPEGAGPGAAVPSISSQPDQHSFDTVDVLLLCMALLVIGVAARFAHAVQRRLRNLCFGKSRNL